MSEAGLPTGIVTFLFSDIEGSTRMFRSLAERYVTILERHREILRSVWRDNGGVEVSTEGDSFLVAFSSADSAIMAAAQAQRDLASEAWPDGVAVKVRIGIHSGLAAPRGDGYISLAVHQASRVIEVGHGGQIVVSQDTEFLVTPSLDVSLRPLGRFRLRDFGQPVRLYQVVGSGLESHFPAPRATPADRTNIVARPTATIGREEAISALADLVSPRRTLTLTGPGGVGKSRIVTDLGLRIASNWDDGVWMVELAGVVDPDRVAGAVAEAVGASLHPDGDRTDDVLQHLAGAQAVVILDNCEHLLPTCRELVERLHADCPTVAVVTTSREPLRVVGEVRWPVEPLTTPGDDATPDLVMGSPAGRLFVERGQSVRPGFTVDDINARAVAGILSHLDGLPLLIELAASHLAVQSPREILTGLESSFRFLRSRDPDLSDRHRTVAGLLDWSYRLLDDGEQAALRRLSMFAAGFSRDTAEAAMVAGDIDPLEVDDLLWSLVERSLVHADFRSDDTRYSLLETVRDYARRHLDEAGETRELASRLADWFLVRVGPWLPSDRAWVSEVSVELPNLRALIPLLSDADQEMAQQLACVIGRHHDATQSFNDGIVEMTRLAGLLEEPTATRVSLLTILSDLHLRTGQVDRARELVEAAEAIRSEHGAPDWDDVAVERTRGEITRRSGDLEGAVEIARRTLEGQLSERGQSRMYNLLGTTSAALGDFETAFEACQKELELNERLGYEGYVASAHGNLAEVALRLGDMPQAALHQRACLDLALKQGSPALVAFSLIVAARISGWREDWDTAVVLHSKAEQQLDLIGLVLYEDDRRESDALLEQARTELGADPFTTASQRGEEISVSDAVELADETFAAAQASISSPR